MVSLLQKLFPPTPGAGKESDSRSTLINPVSSGYKKGPTRVGPVLNDL